MQVNDLDVAIKAAIRASEIIAESYGNFKKALETNDFSQKNLDQYHRDWNKVFGKELRDLSFFALMALKLPERMVYYGTRDEKLCEIFADLFLGVTPGGLGKRKPITRAVFDAIRYPYFGLG
mgnify:CR=1 FL=1